MFTVRATRRLLTHLAASPAPHPTPPTTVLGDWYANTVNGNARFLICISERTFLPVLLPGSAASNLPAALADALPALLDALGVHPTKVAAERAAMADAAWGKTANRHVVGFMNEFAFMATERVAQPRPDLREMSQWLAGTPCRMCFPDRATREAFG